MLTKHSSATLLALASLLLPFDFIAFSLSAYSIQTKYMISIIQLPWALSAQLIAFLFFSGLFFQLSESRRAKPLFISGLLLYALSSLFIINGNSFVLFILARLFQGAALSLVLSSTSHLTQKDPNKSYLIFGSIMALGIFISPYLTSLFTAKLSLPYLFYIPGAYALVIAVFSLFMIQFEEIKESRLDPVGFLLIGASMAILILALAVGLFWGWGLSSLFFFLSFLCFNLTFFVEQKESYPLFELELFQDRQFFTCFIPLLFVQFALWPTLFFVPIYLQYYLGIPLSSIGLWFLIFTAGITIGHFLSLSGYKRGYIRLNIGLSLSCITVSLFLMSFLSDLGQRGYILFCIALLGLGWGFLYINTYSGSLSLFSKKLAKRGFAFTEIFPFFFGAIGLSIGINLFIRKFNHLFYANLSNSSAPFTMDINLHFFDILRRVEEYPTAVIESFRLAFVSSLNALSTFLSWIGVITLIFSLIFIPLRGREVLSEKD